MNRREVLLTLAAAPALAASTEPAPASAPARTPKPLPFNPAKLKGLSEKLLVSHHDNNYAGAVKNLSKTEEALTRVTKEMPAFMVSGLKERELAFRNSVTLHEAYFANLGGDGRMPAAFAHFEEPLRTCALSQAGGSGWTLLCADLATSELNVTWSGHHSQALAGAVPLLVLDMYEHSYALDYGAAAAKYVDAFMANANWEEVARRHELAIKASALMRG